ncbi:MAG TPA: penicillin-binding protein [Bryobacteraceae bacterium]|jgi:cell division protein FtsI (penicillin-binding protein 3)|nr:penicillin-binding protein [Bryobacteraceae bacterium]
MNTLATRRVHLLARLAFVWVALIVARLVQLQILQHNEYKKLAAQQQEKTLELQAPRGTIVDRMGQRLAISLPAESVCVDPLRIPDLSVAADILSKILNVDSNDLLARMTEAAAEKHGFVWVKRKITAEESAQLRDLKLDWIEFRSESQRFYPNQSLCAHVIGDVDFAQKGNGGIEQSLEARLKGRSGELHVTRDVQKRGFESKVESQPQAGQDIRLTIDARIQFVAEREMKKMVLAHHAKWGSAVAMDPHTGDILALANYPTFDPNSPPKKEDLKARENLAVTAPFEPGSVFKVVTLSAALETTRLRPETVINCGGGKITLFGRTIHDVHQHWDLSMEDVLARSSNIGAINIGLTVGQNRMYEYVRRFGFGHRTGIPLPGESPGMVRPLHRWEKTSIASVSMGHEVGVTALQLARACTVIASGGLLIQPRLTMDTPIAQPVRILKPETALTMRRMMEGVVLKTYGTGHKYCRIPGYTSAGKTGSAQIYDYREKKYTHLYNASFMGFAPVTNPAVVVVVTISGTEGNAGFGGPTAGPAFREIAAAALRMLDVPKDLPEMLTSPDTDPVDENDLAIAGLGSSIPPPLVQAEDAVAADDRPAASADSASDQRLFLPGVKNDPARDLAGPRVPNFRGKTLRDVIEESSALGIPVEFKGGGIAQAQVPEAGAVLPLGQSVRVQFGR